MEKTLIILKPDVAERKYIGDIITRFERKGFVLEAIKMIQFNIDLVRQHYGKYEDKPFYGELSDYMMRGPSVVIVLSGDSVITQVRTMVGATDPVTALPGTIRGDFASCIRYNMIHASDSPEAFIEEYDRFFS